MNKELKQLKNWLLLNRISFFKKEKLLIQLFFFFLFSAKSQQIANYISNGSFEVLYSCSFPSEINKAKYWRSIDSVSNGGGLCSSCSVINNVPYNGFGFQYPKNGNNYILCTFFCQPPSCTTTNNRGYLRNRLKTSLIAGKTYCVKFYVNISDLSSYGIANFGAYFGDNSIDTITKCEIPLTYLNPQVENTVSNIIIDTLGWSLITGTFVANGTEKHCVIGNFKSDAITTKTLINSSSLPSIFTDVTIDNVSCIPLDLPAYAGPDVWAMPGNTLYIGRPQDVGIDEACTWYNLTNTTTPIANLAGITVTVSASTQTYMVKQDICGVIKYDTVVVHASSVGLNELKIKDYELKIYPNPTANELNIEFLNVSSIGSATELQIEIINVLGQMIREEELVFKDKHAVIKTDNLPNGVYVLTLLDTASPTRSDKLQTVSKRFIIAR